uniref:COX15/CtaA family protein n=1 Tax=Janibacter limosus TaxID=53458 RepID=A0AC61U0S4_9MICO|nr:COX15/CtaA family protein [Janibacter limosus]
MPQTLSSAARRWLPRLLLLNLIAEVGIVVTGGLVRLTGSGLGCPTRPAMRARVVRADGGAGAGHPQDHRVRQPHAYRRRRVPRPCSCCGVSTAGPVSVPS